MRFLFLLFIGLPILEMWLLIEVGGRIGALPTVALVALTAFIGINLLRQQGLSTLTRAQARLNAGEVPAAEILEGMCLAVGGALLLTPGFLTDAIGFCCLIAPIRKRIVASVLASGLVRANAAFQYQAAAAANQDPEARPHEPEQASGSDNVTLEGEYRRED
ncbi:MAG: UPF0716 protein FxsA [Bermanella sp.]|jgi:UPF0716 protein FxsA